MWRVLDGAGAGGITGLGGEPVGLEDKLGVDAPWQHLVYGICNEMHSMGHAWATADVKKASHTQVW